jgi:hypothetical protein
MSSSSEKQFRDVLSWFILAIGIFIAVQILAGCTERKEETSEQTTTTKDVVNFKATIPFPTGEGVKLLPISGTITATGSKVAESTAHSETRTAPDTEALAAALGQVVDRIAPAIAATATPWSTASPRRSQPPPHRGRPSSVASVPPRPPPQPATWRSRSASRSAKRSRVASRPEHQPPHPHQPTPSKDTPWPTSSTPKP